MPNKYQLKDGSIYWHKVYYALMPKFMTSHSLPGIGGYNLAYYLIRPHRVFADYYREVKWFIQRGRRGYADCDVWSVDGYLTRIVPQMLETLRKNAIGYPVGSTPKKWDTKLKQMINAFTIARQISDYEYISPQAYKKALKLFRKDFDVLKMYYFSLWD